MYENEPDVKKVIDTAKGVEGLVRQMGVHATRAGEPIVDHAPIWVKHTEELLGVWIMNQKGRRAKIITDKLAALGLDVGP